MRELPRSPAGALLSGLRAEGEVGSQARYISPLRLYLTCSLMFFALASVTRPIGALVQLAVVPYHYLALSRVFGGSRMQTFWKGSAIGVLYWIAILAVMAGLASASFAVPSD